jgi:hypothetical protein
MKIEALFNLLHDAQDLLSIFEGVEATPQMVSRLDRLKRGDAPQDLLDSIEALRLSLSEAFNSNLEMDGALSGDGEDDDPLADDLLDGLPDEDAAQADAADGQNQVASTSQEGENPSQ